MEINSKIDYTKNIKAQDVYTESATEYVLPDYLGDVRKVLFTSASVRPSAKFAGGDEVECSGIVVYNMIYLDSENELSSVEFTSDYDYSVKCSAETYKDSVVDTRVSNYAMRLVGPRKIAAKSSITGSVRLCINDSISLSCDSAERRDDAELAEREIKVRDTVFSQSVEREYAESVISLESVIADEISVIYSDIQSSIDSVEYEDSSAHIKGKLRMLAIVKSEESGAFLAEKNIPIDESIPFENLNEEMKIMAELTASSVKATVNPDESGCSVVVSGIVEISAVAECNRQLRPVTDGYFKKCEVSNQYEEFIFSEFIDAVTVKGSHSAEISRGDIESNNIREVVFLSAVPKVESVKQDGKTVKIIGEIRYHGVASEIGDDDKISYTGIKFSSPFASNVNINCQNSENLHCDIKVVAHSATASLDSDNLYGGCIIESSVVACEEKSERILVSMEAREDEAFEKCGSKITVYYPTSKDTLFSVAKKYHTSCAKLASDNSITEEVFASDNPGGELSGVKRLLIY